MGRQTTRRKPGDLPKFITKIESSGARILNDMTLKNLFLLCFMFCCQLLLAQDSIVNNLQEVVVSDVLLSKNSASQNVSVLSDSIIKTNKPSLTSLLNYNSLVYFKENGLGMVSSPSFRGTTAQQTAVIWNGININSQLNGQTDFNTISTQNFSSIAIRSGGGSAIYGSSAIGGTIHLNNDFDFKDSFSNNIQLNYGSFNTQGVHLNSEITIQKWATQIGFSRNSSDNDYTFPNSKIKNQNGQFYNNSFNINFGLKLNPNNFIKFYSQFFDGERHFSASLAAVSNSKYQNFDSRNLLEWKAIYKHVTSSLRLAHLQEEYKYFENKNFPKFSFGKAETSIIKYDLAFNILDKLNINTIIDYTQTKGFGSDLMAENRKIGAASILIKHQVLESFLYELSARKEVNNLYESPFLFSIGTVLKPFYFYKIKLNGSQNFRIPSFNDLYWKGSGNPNLKPEKSNQAEIIQEINFKKYRFQITGFGIKIRDLLQWKPDVSGVWSPENVSSVTTFGAEIVFKTQQNLGKSIFDFTTTYGFTKSVNDISKKELIYVPNHKWVTNLNYTFKRISLNNQLLYTGDVFTSSDNQNILKDFTVFNSSILYAFGKKDSIKVGFQCANILNEKYQNVLNRPLPGRNYTINCNLIF